MNERLHEKLARLNHLRFTPAIPMDQCFDEQVALQREELEWIEHQRTTVATRARSAPCEPREFISWFENLANTGPGQNDSLFPWLAETASLREMKWFLRQEVAGEAGFDDLVALTQLRMPERVKLELAANYWDEMGRGHAGGMHGPMLARMAEELELAEMPDPIVWESTALGNLLAGLAAHRCYAYQSIGALGVVELTAPGRAELVNAGLKRLGLTRQYYALHATLDKKHSASWNREAILPLVEQDPTLAPLIAEGALLRLSAGAACFERYRQELWRSSIRRAG